MMVLREATCSPLETLMDSTGKETYILRDVAVHDPDGSVTTFKTVCKSCHSIMDQIAPAFIYHDFSADSIIYGFLNENNKRERIIPVPPISKMLKVVNQNGYIPRDDAWRAEFSDAQMALLGLQKDGLSGFGVQSRGKALANSEAFAQCQPTKAFKTICGRDPTAADKPFISSLVQDFKSKNFVLKNAFIKSAVYCAQGVQ